MSALTNISAQTNQTGRKKRGGYAEAVTNRLSVMPCTLVCGPAVQYERTRAEWPQAASAKCQAP